MQNKKQAFTLVELIVVITILAILGTIAFISLQGYSASSRDSVRISDVGNMRTSLELFHLNSGKYPLPDNNEIVSYSGDTLWYQGTFGETVVSQLSRNMNEAPTDPLTEREYVFSTANNKNEFQILTLLESDLSLNTISQTNAATVTVIPKVDGTYNGVFLKTPNYIVPTPSIISAEEIGVGSGLVLNSTNIKSQVTNLGKNIPKVGNISTSTGQLNIALSVFTGSITKDDTDEKKELVMIAIQNTYTGSELANTDIYKTILNATTQAELVGLLETVVLKNTTTVVTTTTSNSCDNTTKPADDLNKTYTVNPTSVNQSYIQDGTECGYTCTGGYTGTNCEIAPFVCGTSTVSAGGYTYTTILGPDGNCWTSQNMNHGTMLANGSTMPSDNNTIEKWCYNNDTNICNTDGGLYTWAEAMGFDASCNTINCTQAEDTTKSVCGQLGTGWGLPTDAQWTALTTAGATGWLGNKLSGIISSLPGYRNADASFYDRATGGFWWSSTEYSITNSWYRHLNSGNATVYSGNGKAYGFSVACIKN